MHILTGNAELVEGTEHEDHAGGHKSVAQVLDVVAVKAHEGRLRIKGLVEPAGERKAVNARTGSRGRC